MLEVHTLIETLRREADPIQQSKIIEQLGGLKAIEAVEILIQHAMLNEYQSGAAIVALGNIGDPRAIDVLILSFRSQNLAWIAKDALVKIGPPALALLIAALHHENPDVRFMAIRALGDMNNPDAIEPLQAVILNDPDDTNQKLARSNLKTLLSATLHDQNAEIRLKAVYGFDWLSDARTIDMLQETADHDSEPAVQRAAQEAIRRLLSCVETDPFETHNLPLLSRETKLMINQLRRKAALPVDTQDNAVLPTNAAGVIEQLQAVALSHPDETVSQLARQAFKQASIDLLRSRYAAARLTAIQNLGKLYDPDIPRLLQQIAADDPDDAVRLAAEAVLPH